MASMCASILPCTPLYALGSRKYQSLLFPRSMSETMIEMIEDDEKTLSSIELWDSSVEKMLLRFEARKASLEEIVTLYSSSLREFMKGEPSNWEELRTYVSKHIHLLNECFSIEQYVQFYDHMEDVLALYITLEFYVVTKQKEHDYKKRLLTVYRTVIQTLSCGSGPKLSELRELHFLHTIMKCNFPATMDMLPVKSLMYNALFAYPSESNSEQLLAARYVLFRIYRKLIPGKSTRKNGLVELFHKRNRSTNILIKRLPIVRNLTRMYFKDHASLALKTSSLVTSIVDKYFSFRRAQKLNEDVNNIIEISDDSDDEVEEIRTINDSQQTTPIIEVMDSDGDDKTCESSCTDDDVIWVCDTVIKEKPDDVQKIVNNTVSNDKLSNSDSANKRYVWLNDLPARILQRKSAMNKGMRNNLHTPILPKTTCEDSKLTTENQKDKIRWTKELNNITSKMKWLSMYYEEASDQIQAAELLDLFNTGTPRAGLYKEFNTEREKYSKTCGKEKECEIHQIHSSSKELIHNTFTEVNVLLEINGKENKNEKCIEAEDRDIECTIVQNPLTYEKTYYVNTTTCQISSNKMESTVSCETACTEAESEEEDCIIIENPPVCREISPYTHLNELCKTNTLIENYIKSENEDKQCTILQDSATSKDENVYKTCPTEITVLEKFTEPNMKSEESSIDVSLNTIITTYEDSCEVWKTEPLFEQYTKAEYPDYTILENGNSCLDSPSHSSSCEMCKVNTQIIAKNTERQSKLQECTTPLLYKETSLNTSTFGTELHKVCEINPDDIESYKRVIRNKDENAALEKYPIADSKDAEHLIFQNSAPCNGVCINTTTTQAVLHETCSTQVTNLEKYIEADGKNEKYKTTRNSSLIENEDSFNTDVKCKTLTVLLEKYADVKYEDKEITIIQNTPLYKEINLKNTFTNKAKMNNQYLSEIYKKCSMLTTPCINAKLVTRKQLPMWITNNIHPAIEFKIELCLDNILHNITWAFLVIPGHAEEVLEKCLKPSKKARRLLTNLKKPYKRFKLQCALRETSRSVSSIKPDRHIEYPLKASAAIKPYEEQLQFRQSSHRYSFSIIPAHMQRWQKRYKRRSKKVTDPYVKIEHSKTSSNDNLLKTLQTDHYKIGKTISGFKRDIQPNDVKQPIRSLAPVWRPYLDTPYPPPQLSAKHERSCSCTSFNIQNNQIQSTGERHIATSQITSSRDSMQNFNIVSPSSFNRPTKWPISQETIDEIRECGLSEEDSNDVLVKLEINQATQLPLKKRPISLKPKEFENYPATPMMSIAEVGLREIPDFYIPTSVTNSAMTASLLMIPLKAGNGYFER